MERPLTQYMCTHTVHVYTHSTCVNTHTCVHTQYMYTHTVVSPGLLMDSPDLMRVLYQNCLCHVCCKAETVSSAHTKVSVSVLKSFVEDQRRLKWLWCLSMLMGNNEVDNEDVASCSGWRVYRLWMQPLPSSHINSCSTKTSSLQSCDSQEEDVISCSLRVWAHLIYWILGNKQGSWG